MNMDARHLFFLMIFWLMETATSYSIDKHILDADKRASMFDLFHVSPEGRIEIVHELDMVLSTKQYQQLYMDDQHKEHNSDTRSNRRKRKAAVDIAKRWPGCKVYYEITDSLDTEKFRELLKDAMTEWEKYTCLEFIESDTAENRVLFQDGKICSSRLGMQGGLQYVQLAPGCRTEGIIIHEIGHTIGWFHEHSRPDRDQYVRVNLDVVPPKYRQNYEKYGADTISTYGVPYDYGSIMHYGDSSFPGSLVAIDPRFQSIMGQQDGLSFKDIKLANVMYDCAGVMGCETKDCGDGFQLYREFKGEERCKCWCDSGNYSDPLVLCSERKPTPTPTVVTTLTPQTRKPPAECRDVRYDCSWLKLLGKCETKMTLMMANCPATCRFCGKGEDLCMDNVVGCGAVAGLCNNPGFRSIMTRLCTATCGQCERPNPCDMYNIMIGDDEGDNSNSNSKATPTRTRFQVSTVLISLLNFFLFSGASLGWLLDLPGTEAVRG